MSGPRSWHHFKFAYQKVPFDAHLVKRYPLGNTTLIDNAVKQISMKLSVKILSLLLMFSTASGFQHLGAAKFYRSTITEAFISLQPKQQDSTVRPGNNPPLQKAYPPNNPGHAHPDRIKPANNHNDRTLPPDTTNKAPLPQRHRAKLAGEQSNP